MFTFWKLYRLISFTYLLVFIFNRAGREYGVGIFKKARLVFRILRNYKKYNPLSTWQQHLLLVEEILRVPKSLKGDVVECGCFDGSTTVTLSIACGLTNRRLFVCDSFEGIPLPKDEEQFTVHCDTSDYYFWED